MEETVKKPFNKWLWIGVIGASAITWLIVPSDGHMMERLGTIIPCLMIGYGFYEILEKRIKDMESTIRYQRSLLSVTQETANEAWAKAELARMITDDIAKDTD